MRKVFYIFFLFPLVIFYSCFSSPASKTVNAPAWVNDVYSVYNRDKYVAATGYGKTRSSAEENAFAALTTFFGQSIIVERSSASSYKQAVTNGVMDGWTDTLEMRNNINTYAVIDTLYGAEIKGTWFDSRDMFYAVAVMERETTCRIYLDLIKANLTVINNLIVMTPDRRNSMEGVIRLKFAAAVADINVSYRNIIRLLENQPGSILSVIQTLSVVRGGDSLRLEAQNIIKTIPIGIRVTNDRNGRIFGAFARCFSDLGFEAVAGNARYVLNANVSLSPVHLPDNPNLFSRIELETQFRDTRDGIVLQTYNFNSREGHVSSLVEAENRCFSEAEKSINDEFAVLLAVYLSQLIPKN